MSTQEGDTTGRKRDHLRIALTRDVAFHGLTTGLEDVSLVHCALPEMDLAAVDTSCSLFRRTLSAPLLISSMTGGTDSATAINRNLAEAAQRLHVAMGLGSARPALENPANLQSFKVRDLAPDIILFANLGAVQLNYGYGTRECLHIVEALQADALVLHLNPLQEALQREGNTNFSGLLGKIEQVCRQLQVPVVVKEVGWGISADVARALRDAGVSGIDIGGAGGTSWAEVERVRSARKRVDRMASTFSAWGIPTADSIRMVRQAVPGLPVIGSGGIRTGLDVAKAIALGADAAGLAAPLLRSAATTSDAVVEHLSLIIEELKLAMFCTGAKDMLALKNVPVVRWGGPPRRRSAERIV